MPHPRSRSIPRRAQALAQVESRYAKSDARSRCMQVDYVARMGIPRETMPFSLVNRVFHQACHTRITDSTGLIVCRGLPKIQEKSSKTVPFSLKSCPKVTNVTFPRSRGKTPPFAKFDAGRRQSGGFHLRRDARHSRVPAFHKRHGTFDSKLFRIFRTLSDGKSELRRQENPSHSHRKIRIQRSAWCSRAFACATFRCTRARSTCLTTCRCATTATIRGWRPTPSALISVDHGQYSHYHCANRCKAAPATGRFATIRAHNASGRPNSSGNP